MQESPSNRSTHVTVQLRRKQDLNQPYDDPSVIIYAPLWVEEGLRKLNATGYFSNVTINYIDSAGNTRSETIDHLDLRTLTILARNEKQNTDGQVKWRLYHDSFPLDVIFAMKKLVKFCIVVGNAVVVNYGGYPGSNPIKPVRPPRTMTIMDMAGLQFQKPYNTGSLVLIRPPEIDAKHRSILDNFIYESIMDEPRPTYEQCQADRTGQFVKIRTKEDAEGFYIEYCDTRAYQAIVACDFVLGGIAQNDLAQDGVKTNYKFLHYGAGFFSNSNAPHGCNYQPLIWKHIVDGVKIGMSALCSQPDHSAAIAQVEFPYYKEEHHHHRHFTVTKSSGEEVNCRFTMKDALQPPTSLHLRNAATNCGDGCFAMMGNEMNYGSVDAAIAENLQNKGNQFNPVLNPLMQAKFVEVNIPQIVQQAMESFSMQAPLEEKEAAEVQIADTAGQRLFSENKPASSATPLLENNDNADEEKTTGCCCIIA